MRFFTLFPFSCNDDWASHPPFSLTRHLSGTDLRAELWVARRGPRARARFVRTALPGPALSVLAGVNRAIRPGNDWARMLLERRYAAALREGDAAHVYRGCSIELLQGLRARHHPVFLERVNTMDHTLKRIMDDAFAREGWPADYFERDAEAILAAQQAQAEAADFIFSPSPLVTESLRERGVAAERILECSYGWEPVRFQTTMRALPAIEGVTVLFLGSIGMRKGAHLLLRAWARAGLRGRLVLAGRLEPMIAKYCADLLRRHDVVRLPYHPDPAPVYRSADVFALPTLEEGSPLVSYEAMGNGLPVVTSPMGAGSVIRHRREGVVLDPHDLDGWVDALRELAGSPETRRAMGDAGRVRAADYTWDKVAQRRYALIKAALARSAG